MQIIQPSDYSSTHYYTHPHPSSKFHLEVTLKSALEWEQKTQCWDIYTLVSHFSHYRI